MSFISQNKLDDRLSAQQKAREAMVERFRKRPAADDPAVIARNAERKAIAEAREARAEERELARIAEEERKAAEIEAARQAEIARKAAEVEAAAERAREAQAAQKAERDARYAARKAKIKLRR
ncbi:DUF6481 family protein [Methylobacterium haplocladii]|uniref:Uncharacterized protein n=1 Tax=Methylobacterium haplocladii TaxID=1176176 RepID=A0A512IQ37_9HYPH|nr:DUF6481 family protein [Methylobacterium haplocladii]GEO99817.1 hypothetical protein MHA02_22050 [Methylobacterium haplocladii]GJD84794.1 hypothetical protein HPGCJGGD_2677 [Methylobacterium haplocladii]GLS59708.1 hypothetical protein GCM10007887_23780 [Methylobacterium haplocladii]